MRQLINPNPNIPCKPGWCLQYVRQTFGLDGVHPTATAGWQASPTKHYGRDFPDAWVPVWYGLDNEPAGHVVLRAPNGNVYSTSDLGNTPHLHPDLGDLERYYAYYGMTLTYRGWTEDIENVSVVAPESIGLAAMGDITEVGDFMATLSDEEKSRWMAAVDRINGVVRDSPVLNVEDGAYMNGMRDAQYASIMDALGKTLNKNDGGYIVGLLEAVKPGATDANAVATALLGIIPAGIAKRVADELAARLAK